MDIRRLKNNDLKVWLPMMDGVEVLARHVTQREFDAISRQATEVRSDPVTRTRREERDEQQFRSLLARAVVLDWRGISDGEAPFPCTPENIDYLVEECTEFRLLVMDAPLSLERMLAAEKEAERKNSSTTSQPSGTIPA
uniref:Uncharacterized protein n=1 Tax=Geobacter metallireducens TaxID=28232 RepID=A0A831U061_GEOME